MKNHSDKIREALTDLGEAKPADIMAWIRKHYPDDPVNPTSYRADLIGCSVNHSSQHHYPSMPKFLLFNKNTKKFRLDPSKITDDEVSNLFRGLAKEPERVDDEQSSIDGIPVARLSITGQIDVPSRIRQRLGLNPGDTIAFIETEKGVEIRKARLRLDFN
jgi:AbrB family looped-hinge helix DNA binding protein